MDSRRTLKRLLALAISKGVLLCAFFGFVRPWYLTWGSTHAEAARRLPGDEIVAHARPNSTTSRAVTIHAPAEQVWPWLAQLGQDRGGFYSYAILEDLVGCEMQNADRVHPEFQNWQLGDKLWMYPPEKLHGMGHAKLAGYEPGRVLAFATRETGTPQWAPYDGSWSFVLEPIDAETSRLLVRGRAGGPRSVFGTVFDRVVFEPIHFAMERKMLLGIKARAERDHVSETKDDLQVLLWGATFALFLAAAVLVLRRPDWRRPLFGFAAAGVAFQLLTFLQPPLLLGLVLVLAVAAVLWAPRPARLTTMSSSLLLLASCGAVTEQQHVEHPPTRYEGTCTLVAIEEAPAPVDQQHDSALLLAGYTFGGSRHADVTPWTLHVELARAECAEPMLQLQANSSVVCSPDHLASGDVKP